MKLFDLVCKAWAGWTSWLAKQAAKRRRILDARRLAAELQHLKAMRIRAERSHRSVRKIDNRIRSATNEWLRLGLGVEQ